MMQDAASDEARQVSMAAAMPRLTERSLIFLYSLNDEDCLYIHRASPGSGERATDYT